jgi:hypothetical protein
MAEVSRAGKSLREYARHRRDRGLPGHTLHAVQTAIEYGRITRLPNGRIDAAAADRLWAETTDDGKRPPHTCGHHTRDNNAELSRPLLALYELRWLLRDMTDPMFGLSGAEADVKAFFRAWLKIPDLLRRIEDGMAAANVPLLEREMPS